MNKLSIIIPVYNEKATIKDIIDKVRSVDLGQIEKEIIIVDDCSIDGTREILDTFNYADCAIIYRDKNEGKGAALRSGFNAASGDWIVIQDADMEYDPNDLKLLLLKARDADVQVVYGSRRLNRNYFKDRHSGFIFALGGVFITWLTNLLYKTDITDEPTCYKMFKSDLLGKIDLKCRRFEFCPEFTAKIAKAGIKIHEVPINYFPRHKNEGKKINWRDGLEAIWTLLKYRF